MKGSLSMSRGSLRPSSSRIHSILVLSLVIALGVMAINFYSNTVQFNTTVERAQELERAIKAAAKNLLTCETHLQEGHKKQQLVQNQLGEVSVRHSSCEKDRESWHEQYNQVESLLADMRQQVTAHEQRIEEYKKMQNESNAQSQELKNTIQKLRNEIDMGKKKNAEEHRELIETKKELENMAHSFSPASSRAIPIFGQPSKPLKGYLPSVPKSTVTTVLKANEGIRSHGGGPIILDKPDAVRAKPDYSVVTGTSEQVLVHSSNKPQVVAAPQRLPTTVLT